MNLAQRLLAIMKEQNLTEAALGKKAGVSQQAINKIVKGETQKPRNLIAIASALNVDPIWLVSGMEPRQNMSFSPEKNLSEEASIFIYTMVHNLDSSFFHLDKNKIAQKLSLPPSLTRRQGLYGFYMQSSVMEPRFKMGDLIIADSYRPPKANEDCVIIHKERSERDFISVLSFSHTEASRLIAFQYNPKKEVSFDMHNVALHRILSLEEFLI